MNITATSGDQFHIKVTPLQLSNAAGGPIYDADQNTHQWVIARYDSGITGFSTDKFSVDYNSADFAGANLSIGMISNDLVLTATTVPEPGTVLGVSAALLGFAGWARRHKDETSERN